jgi:hypothetical protein
MNAMDRRHIVLLLRESQWGLGSEEEDCGYLMVSEGNVTRLYIESELGADVTLICGDLNLD